MPAVENRSLVVEDLFNPPEGPHVLRLTGPLVLTTLSEFQARVRTDRSHNLILDFSGVPYMDSTGIGGLVSVYVHHYRDGNGVSLVGVNERVRHVLRLAHVEQFFHFFDNLAQAQAGRE